MSKIETLSDGSKRCPECGVFYLPMDWERHQGSKRCAEMKADRPRREEAMRGALSSVNMYFRGK